MRTLKPASPGMKYCPRCKTEHPVSAFAPRLTASDGLRTYCRAADLEVAAETRRRAQARQDLLKAAA